MKRELDQKILDETRSFEVFSQKYWPVIRPFFKHKIAERCKNCTISSRVSYVEITNGICNLCKEHEENIKNEEEEVWNQKYLEHQRKEVDELFKSTQGKGQGRYDAIVLFSGGKDSVYMVHRLRRDYPGLRILLMTWDNGFYSKLSLEIADEVSSKLDLDHITFKPKSDVYKTLYRYTLQNVRDKGSYQTVDRLDGSLNQFLGCHFAYEMNIPLVLSGVDFAQELIMQHNTYYRWRPEDMRTRTFVDRMERRSGFKISEIFSEEDQKLFWDGTGKDPDRIPQYILPLLVWRPDKGAVKFELEAEGLVPSKDASPIITNNQVIPVMSAIDFRTIGYCSFEPEFAEMIRFRENDPVYWRNAFECLEFSVKYNILLKKAVNRVLKKLDLTLEEVGLSI